MKLNYNNRILFRASLLSASGLLVGCSQGAPGQNNGLFDCLCTGTGQEKKKVPSPQLASVQDGNAKNATLNSANATTKKKKPRFTGFIGDEKSISDHQREEVKFGSDKEKNPLLARNDEKNKEERESGSKYYQKNPPQKFELLGRTIWLYPDLHNVKDQHTIDCITKGMRENKNARLFLELPDPSEEIEYTVKDVKNISAVITATNILGINHRTTLFEKRYEWLGMDFMLATLGTVDQFFTYCNTPSKLSAIIDNFKKVHTKIVQPKIDQLKSVDTKSYDIGIRLENSFNRAVQKLSSDLTELKNIPNLANHCQANKKEMIGTFLAVRAAAYYLLDCNTHADLVSLLVKNPNCDCVYYLVGGAHICSISSCMMQT